MRKNILGAGCVLWFLLGGCSNEQSMKDASPDYTSLPPVTVSPLETPVTPLPAEPVADDIFVSNDSLVALQLEQARQHYLSATRAEDAGDSVRATSQFELSIQLLNELGYFPGIESNQDFTDLSKAIVEDYERYIRKTGIVDSASSIFALREKLNLISEQMDTSKIHSKRLFTGTSIPLVDNSLVDQNIQFFTTRGRVHMERWLNRSGKYFPMMKRIMREEGVPEEIVYLAFIESGMQPEARSWAKAVGLWQFMKGTGQMYGLRGNFWYDERRDFEKATRAAAHHLKDLYEDFDDWYLVMAAYNSGAGKVYRAMRRSGTNDFWEMRNFLPRETRNYVPSYIAVAIIGMNPEEYGFTNIEHTDSLAYDYVSVNDCVDLETLASCAGTDLETLLELNPALIHRCTPPVSSEYQLRVPKSTDKQAFARNYAGIPDEKKGYVLVHVVHRGDNLQKVARHYGISQQALAQANEISTRSRLKNGTRLMIPIAKGGRIPASKFAANHPYDEPSSRESQATVRTQARTIRVSAETYADRTKISYKIKGGDTIGKIAEWFGVRAADIRNWNNLPYGRRIISGQTLAVWVAKDEAGKLDKVNAMSLAQKAEGVKKPAVRPEPADEAFSYVVRSGDSLDKIAQAHGVTVSQIQRWNSLRKSRIVPGKKLLLYPRIAEVSSQSEKKVADAKAQSKGIAKQTIYVVRSGDTISEIAQAHAVQESQLRAWNALKRRSKIYAGQELIVRKGAD